MDNFNLHYECLDEQDDYHALLKKHCRLKEQKTLSLLQDQYDNDCDLGIHQNFEEDYGDLNFLGPNAIKKTYQMIETELMLNKVGWLDWDQLPKLFSNIHKFHPLYTKQNCNGRVL